MEVFTEWFSLLLQIWAAVITNRDSVYYYKSGQLLQIGAIITNRCRTGWNKNNYIRY